MTKMMYVLQKCDNCGRLFRTRTDIPREKCPKCRHKKKKKKWRRRNPEYCERQVILKKLYRRNHPDFVLRCRLYQRAKNIVKNVVALGSLSEKRLTEIENRGLNNSDFRVLYYGIAHSKAYQSMPIEKPKKKRCQCGGFLVLAKNPDEYVCSECGLVHS